MVGSSVVPYEIMFLLYSPVQVCVLNWASSVTRDQDGQPGCVGRERKVKRLWRCIRSDEALEASNFCFRGIPSVVLRIFPGSVLPRIAPFGMPGVDVVGMADL